MENAADLIFLIPSGLNLFCVNFTFEQLFFFSVVFLFPFRTSVGWSSACPTCGCGASPTGPAPYDPPSPWSSWSSHQPTSGSSVWPGQNIGLMRMEEKSKEKNSMNAWNILKCKLTKNNMRNMLILKFERFQYIHHEYGCKPFAAGRAWMSFWLVVRTASSKSNPDFPCKAPRLLQLRLKPFVDRAKMPRQTTIASDVCPPASQHKIKHS